VVASSTAPSGDVPRAFGVEASTEACHITFSGENPLGRVHAIDESGDKCVTLDSHHGQGVVPNPESAAGPADSRQAAPAVHVRGRPVPSAASLAALMATSAKRAELWETIRFRSLQGAFLRAGVDLPPISAPTASETPPAECSLNIPLKTAMSEYVRCVRPSLVEFVELVRCQTLDDYRPNKALVPSALQHVCKGYEHIDSLIQIASEGVRVRLTSPSRGRVDSLGTILPQLIESTSCAIISAKSKIRSAASSTTLTSPRAGQSCS
jgi:hypothetical protein